MPNTCATCSVDTVELLADQVRYRRRRPPSDTLRRREPRNKSCVGAAIWFRMLFNAGPAVSSVVSFAPVRGRSCGVACSCIPRGRTAGCQLERPSANLESGVRREPSRVQIPPPPRAGHRRNASVPNPCATARSAGPEAGLTRGNADRAGAPRQRRRPDHRSKRRTPHPGRAPLRPRDQAQRMLRCRRRDLPSLRVRKLLSRQQ